MKHTALLAGCVLGGLAISAFGWREYRHRENRREHTVLEIELKEKIHELQSGLEEAREAAEADATSQREMGIELQSLVDRSANLTAQRDHLRAESERQANLFRERAEALEAVKNELQATRHELLLKSAEPRALEAEISRKDTHIQELETHLDRQATVQSVYPDLFTVEGISGDATVLALSGSLIDKYRLPAPVRLCRKNNVLLIGWINRIEDSRIIVHTEEWQVPPSALVKGEKVFILPGRNHDSDP